MQDGLLISPLSCVLVNMLFRCSMFPLRLLIYHILRSQKVIQSTESIQIDPFHRFETQPVRLIA
jgi:hypothetical protein